MSIIMAKLKVQSFARIPNEYVSVERSRGLSLLEEKLVYMLINAMQKRWESTKKLEQIDYDFIASGVISFDEFSTTMQIGAKDDKIIYQSLKDLFDYSLAVHQNNDTRFIHLFGDMIIKHETKQIKYKLGEVFVEYFTGICRDYFKLSVEEVIGLNSTHAIRIYQLLKTKQNMDKREFEYSIAEIKQQLNIEKKYSLYANFKNKVLELSKQQINSSDASQFNIDYEEIKTGKAVTSIKFHILPKGKSYYQENNLIAGYKLDQINKNCNKWKKEHDENDVVYILSDKILSELKQKNPSRVVVANWLDTIHTMTKQQKLI
jgi:plasmid replication initiation protein